MFFSKMLQKQRPSFDSFPYQQLFILALIRVSEPIALTSIFPYAWKLVLHFGVGERSDASFYAGVLISAFSLAEALTAMFWGAISDRVGRKPVLLLGCAGTALSLLIVGFSTNFWVALFGRALGGLLNGNIGVLQTMVAEVTVNPKHEPKAFAVMPFVWSIGTIIGPSIGGFFAEPAVTYPTVFSAEGLFGRFPFLLPNLICAGMMMMSIAAGYAMLDETHPDKQPWDAPTYSDIPDADTETPLIPKQNNPYGTFASDSEKAALIAETRRLEQDSATPPKIYNKQVIMFVVALGLFSYHSMTYDNLLPIFLQDDRVAQIMDRSSHAFAGGLGLSTQQVGVIMSLDGTIALFVQAVIFPLMVSWLGVWRLFLAVTILHPVAYLLVPFLELLPSHLLYPGIYTCLATRNILTILAYPLLLILIKEAVSSHSYLGRINGLAASTGAACRTVASPVSGFLYGAGSKMENTSIAWFASAAVAVLGALQALWIQHDRSCDEARRLAGEDDLEVQKEHGSPRWANVDETADEEASFFGLHH